MNGSPGGGDFERWLEAELRRTVRSEHGPSPRATQAAYRQARPSMRRLAAGGVRAVVIIAMAAAALGGGAVAAMATGDPNPVRWGQRLVQAVQDCQDQVVSDPLNVGHCVGELSRPRSGPQSEDRGPVVQPSPSPSPLPPTRQGQHEPAADPVSGATDPTGQVPEAGQPASPHPAAGESQPTPPQPAAGGGRVNGPPPDTGKPSPLYRRDSSPAPGNGRSKAP